MTARPAFYRRWLSPEGYLGLHLSIGFLVALLAAWAFSMVAVEVIETPHGHAADTWARDVVRAFDRPPVRQFMEAITVVGNGRSLAVLSLVVGAWLAAVRSHRRLYAFLAAMIGGGLLNGLLKLYFARARPPWPVVDLPSGYSFPSGHAMGSLLFFGSLAYVLYFTVQAHPAWRAAAVAACLAAAGVVGASRVYLGVHYLTDVVAGFFAALCWMGVCLTGTEGWVRWRDWRRQRAAARHRTAVAE